MPAASSSAAERVRPIAAAIVGIAGPSLGDGERRLIQAGNPWGFILFGRNCVSPDQVRALVSDLRGTVGRADAPVLIDQEGGRVARLGPPHWPPRPPARRIGDLAGCDPDAGCEAARLHARLIAADLAPLGISVNCAPVLDLARPDQTRAIGDRACAADPELVARLGQAMIEGFLTGGILPVIKHLPGHGRARRDSHVGLPIVAAEVDVMARSDWVPFRACRFAPFAMTAHVLYPALDAMRPATLSPTIIAEVIRGEIGFQGALLSDDLSMGALRGSLSERTATARAAGCDIALHCNGRFAEMVEVLEAAGPLEGQSAARARAALDCARAPDAFDAAAGEARLAQMLRLAEPTV